MEKTEWQVLFELIASCMAKTALELSPKEWQEYILPQRSLTPEAKARWERAWQLIPRLANLLRQEFGATQIKVFGSAINVDYFSEASDIDLAAWDIPKAQYFAAVLAVDEFDSGFKVDLVDPTLCRLKLRKKIEDEGIAV